MADSKISSQLLLNRRAFLIVAGSVTVFVSSCGVSGEISSSDSISKEIEKIMKAKNQLVLDARKLLRLNPALRKPLQVVIEQNLVHIAALSSNFPTLESASANPVNPNEVGLPALTTRCAVFSTNSLIVARSLPDPEVSRVVALIAGSEMQHYALLSGYIS